MEFARWITPAGTVAAPLPEDDARFVVELVDPSAPETDPAILWGHLEAVADRIDASAPNPLVTDAHGMLTEAELRRWS